MKRVTFEILDRELQGSAEECLAAAEAALRPDPNRAYTGPLAGLTEVQAKAVRRIGKRVQGALVAVRREGVTQ